jgi:hypothetical protein
MIADCGEIHYTSITWGRLTLANPTGSHQFDT